MSTQQTISWKAAIIGAIIFMVIFFIGFMSHQEKVDKTVNSISTVTLPNGQEAKILIGLDRQELADNFIKQGFIFTAGRSQIGSYLDIYSADNGETKISVFGKGDSGVYLITSYISHDNSSFKTKDFISYLGWIAPDSILSASSHRWAENNYKSPKIDTTFSNGWHYALAYDHRITSLYIDRQ